MGSFKKLGTALVLSSLLAGGLNTASLEAKGKKGDDGQAATCAYLYSVITYPYVSTTVLLYSLSLYNYYGCGAQ